MHIFRNVRLSIYMSFITIQVFFPLCGSLPIIFCCTDSSDFEQNFQCTCFRDIFYFFIMFFLSIFAHTSNLSFSLVLFLIGEKCVSICFFVFDILDTSFGTLKESTNFGTRERKNVNIWSGGVRTRCHQTFQFHPSCFFLCS